MAEKRTKILIILASVFTFLGVLVAVQPFVSLPEGTFVWAAYRGLFAFFAKYVGYFELAFINLTLVPFALLGVTLLVDAIRKNTVLVAVLHFLSFVALLILSRTLQGGFIGLPSWCFNFSLILFALAIPMIAFDKVRVFLDKKAAKYEGLEREEKKNFAQRYLDKKKYKAENPEAFQADNERERIMKISVEKAREMVVSTVVPEFGAFPMAPIHEDSATIGGSVDTSIYSAVKREAEIISQNRSQRASQEMEESSDMAADESLNQEKPMFDDEPVFETKNLKRKIRQDKIAQETMPKPAFAPTTQMDDQFQTFSKPVDYSSNSNETIVDEGSDDEDPDEARRKYEEMMEDKTLGDIDYISGVAGLSSGSEGRKSYLINADKYKYKFPSSSLLKHYPVSAKTYADMDHDPDGITIVETLRQFKVETQLIAIQHGPTFTLYELQLAPGIRVGSVQNFADNIAMNLAVSGVRILAPIPGKIAIGIEVPNRNRDTIGFDVMYQSLSAKQLKIPFVLGKTITGESIVIDLAGTPHLLVAGTTGSGKSVCVNSLICSVLYTKTPAEVRMILVDPKMVELSGYNGIPHLLTPVITQPKRAIKAMQFVISEMERRMQLFKNCGAKKIEDYNKKIEEKAFMAVKLPYIMVIVDEFADLMMVVGKEMEAYIQRITQIARFTGIHLVLATQRPSVDVITGIIKSNIPSRIAFAVSDVTNSKIIIDRVGADKLLGRGDMLYLGSSSPEPIRIQGAYIDPEIESIVEAVKKNGEPDYIDEAFFEDEEEEDGDVEEDTSSSGEDMFTRAWKIVSDRGEASASYLQRRLNIGYNRAATLIEKLEEEGYIGPARGSKPREILRKYIPQEFE